MSHCTCHRLWAIVLKEFIQMRRDRVTFGMMIGIPLMQLMVFGFAINSDPRHLPTALRMADQGPFARTLVAALRQSEYFSIVREAHTEAEAAELLFIAANLAVGITFSTLAKNQLQAVQMAFFFLPSILLSGFMLPFRGMPEWAQWIGSCLPNTHFLRIVRGILLKGNGPAEIASEIWPLVAFVAVALTIGIKRYRQTLD
jgi:ABC-2 type transporter